MATNKQGKIEQKIKHLPVDRQNETPEAKFLRLALPRVNKSIKAISQIGKLGARSYASTEEQRNKIHGALNEAVELAMRQLNGVKSIAKFNF
jgi:hypothetical protein